MADNYNRFKSLTIDPISNTSSIPSFVPEKFLSNIQDGKLRLEFYNQLLPEIKEALKVFQAYQSHKVQHDKYNEAQLKVVKSLKRFFINSKDEKDPNKLIIQLNNLVKSNPLLANFNLTKVEDVVAKPELPVPLKEGVVEQNIELSEQKGGTDKGSFYADILKEYDKEEKNKEKVLEKVENNAIYNIENETISFTDRIVFIALTFILRNIVLFFVSWGLNSHMVNSFKEAFIFYIVTYVILFIAFVLLVNSGNNVSLKLLFYYINTDIGTFRIILHLLVQFLLFPIPFVVQTHKFNINSSSSYEDQRKVYNLISTFTFFVWILTTIIALRY